jgi:type I restriction enzyme, S subunit
MDRPWIEAGLKFACVSERDLPCLLVQRVARLRAKTNLDQKYLRYVIASRAFTNHILGIQTGTAVPHISGGQIKSYRLRLPPFATQRRIADILGALDNKIECNRRINQTLEAMAQALYKHWFVDVESGDIPEGWRAGKLGDIAENVRVAADPRNVPSETPYIGLEHMPRGSIALSEWGTAKDVTSNKSEFHRKQILFGKLRPYFKKVGVAPTDGVCSSDILVIQPRSQNSFGLVLCQLIQDDFISFTEMSSGGTKMPRISWEQMAQYPIAIPPENVMTELNSQIESWVDIIISNVKENQALTRTRDYLLPKLLSGEVEVEEGALQM